MAWHVRLTKHTGQYRITLPKDLIEEAGFEGVQFVELKNMGSYGILIKEYYGKKNAKRDLQKNRHGSD